MSNFSAETVIEQLGGSKFLAMTGAKEFVKGEYSVTFRIPRNKSKANKVEITLTPMDDYTVTFWKIGRHGLDWTLISQSMHLQADGLAQVFTKITGMDTKL